MLRAYRLWDHKKTIRRVLLVVFVACMTGSLVLCVRMVLTLLEIGSCRLSPDDR